jgi:hypothetical protein
MIDYGTRKLVSLVHKLATLESVLVTKVSDKSITLEHVFIFSDGSGLENSILFLCIC